MGFRLALAQCGWPDDGDVLKQVERYAAQSADAGAQLLVFPENLMLPQGVEPADIAAAAEPLDGPFATGIARIAAAHSLWIVFTMAESFPAPGTLDGSAPPYNTAVVMDDAGTMRRVYHKCHLYDAHGVYESDRYTPGDALCEPTSAPFATLALGICYDLRFPETLRAQLPVFDLALFPACWHDGPHKAEHWETLLRARAVENECYVAGICRCGEGLVEQSLVVDPLGQVVARAPEGDALLVANVKSDDVERVRAAMPVLAHRRPELYGALLHP